MSAIEGRILLKVLSEGFLVENCELKVIIAIEHPKQRVLLTRLWVKPAFSDRESDVVEVLAHVSVYTLAGLEGYHHHGDTFSSHIAEKFAQIFVVVGVVVPTAEHFVCLIYQSRI